MSASTLTSDSTTTADMMEFDYHTQLVIYNFLRFVPTSAAALANEQRAAEQASECSATPTDDAAAGNIECDGIRQPAVINGMPADHTVMPVDSKFQKMEADISSAFLLRAVTSHQSRDLVEDAVKDSVGRHMARKTAMSSHSAPTTVIKKKSTVKILNPTSPHDTDTRFSIAFQPLPSDELSSLSSPVVGAPQHTSTPSSDKPEQRTGVDSDGGNGVEYVDIEEMDVKSVEENTENGVLPSVSVSLRKEITHGIQTLQREYSRQMSERCEDEFDCGSPVPGFENQSGTPPLNVAGSPTQEQLDAVAEELRMLGDLLQLEYAGRIDNIVSSVRGLPRDLILAKAREQFDVLLQCVGDKLKQVVLTCMFCQRLVYFVLSQGVTSIRDVVVLTAQIIETYAAEFIIQNGGWNHFAAMNVVELPVGEERQNSTPSETTVHSTDGMATGMDHSGGAGDGVPVLLPPDTVDAPSDHLSGSKSEADRHQQKSVENGNYNKPEESEMAEQEPVESKLTTSELLTSAPVEGAGNAEPTRSLGNQVYIVISVALLAVAALVSFAYRRSRSSS